MRNVLTFYLSFCRVHIVPGFLFKNPMVASIWSCSCSSARSYQPSTSDIRDNAWLFVGFGDRLLREGTN